MGGGHLSPGFRGAAAAPPRAVLRGLARSAPGRRLLGRLDLELQRALGPPPGRELPADVAPAEPERAADDWRRWQTQAHGEPLASPDRPALPALNVLCSLEAWQNAALVQTMRRELTYYVDEHPEYPLNLEHRKHWEYAHVVVGLEQLGALGPAAWVLGVGAGHEDAVYDLTTRARWVFATDIYGGGHFSSIEADFRMLLDPDHFARCPYNRNHLVAEHMDALDLRFDDGTFDVAYSLSSLEHFGGLDGARRGLAEMGRVLKPGGIAALTTECIVNGADAYRDEALALFTPAELRHLFGSIQGLTPVQDLDLELSARTRACRPIPLTKALEDSALRRHVDYPHVLLEHAGRVYTSCAVFLRRHA